MNRVLIATLLVGGMGCADQPTGHPMAFFTVSPRYICADDDHQTLVQLNAGQSSPGARLIIAGESPDDGKVELAWSVQTSDFKVMEGGLDQPQIALTLKGDRPVTIRLTVTNEDGDTGADENTIGLIYPTAKTCADDDDCAMNETCAEFGAGHACLPTQRCDTDDGCPKCYRCDQDARRCIP